MPLPAIEDQRSKKIAVYVYHTYNEVEAAIAAWEVGQIGTRKQTAKRRVHDHYV